MEIYGIGITKLCILFNKEKILVIQNYLTLLMNRLILQMIFKIIKKEDILK
jgi:hypothetical protein